MQKLIITAITGGLLAASSAVAGDFSVPIAAAGPSAASAGSIGTVAVGYHNVYNFRGVELGNDMVTTQLDFAKSYAGLDFSLGAWYASVEDGPNRGSNSNFDELDLYGAVSKDLGFATATLGYIHYNNFNDADDAQEISFGLSKNLFGFDTSVTYFWDIEQDNDGYTEFAVSRSQNVYGHNIDLGLVVGYLIEEGGLSYATLTASYDIPLGVGTVTPYISQVWELDELEANTGAGGLSQSNEFVAGVNFSVAF